MAGSRRSSPRVAAQPKKQYAESSYDYEDEADDDDNDSSLQDESSDGDASIMYDIDDGSNEEEDAGENSPRNGRGKKVAGRRSSAGAAHGKVTSPQTSSEKKRKSAAVADDVGPAKQRPASRVCRKEGCDKWVKNGGVCQQHGAKKYTCREAGCTSWAVTGGVCVRHGAKQKRKPSCSVDCCTNLAVRGGVCYRHGAKPKPCSVDGCPNNAKKGGVCVRHGAKPKRCSVEGCTNQVVRGGVCWRHGANQKICTVDGCTTRAQQGGLCIRHARNHDTPTVSDEGSDYDGDNHHNNRRQRRGDPTGSNERREHQTAAAAAARASVPKAARIHSKKKTVVDAVKNVSEQRNGHQSVAKRSRSLVRQRRKRARRRAKQSCSLQNLLSPHSNDSLAADKEQGPGHPVDSDDGNKGASEPNGKIVSRNDENVIQSVCEATKSVAGRAERLESWRRVAVNAGQGPASNKLNVGDAKKNAGSGNVGLGNSDHTMDVEKGDRKKGRRFEEVTLTSNPVSDLPSGMKQPMLRYHQNMMKVKCEESKRNDEEEATLTLNPVSDLRSGEEQPMDPHEALRWHQQILVFKGEEAERTVESHKAEVESLAESHKAEVESLRQKLAEMKRIWDEPTAQKVHLGQRAGEKEKLLQNLREHNVRLGPSKVHGEGVHALTKIAKGTVLFQFNGTPSHRSINLSKEDLETLPDYVQKMVKDFILPVSHRDGFYYPVPKHGLNCALGLSWYLNSAQGTGRGPNVKFTNRWDASGYNQIVVTEDIEEGEELFADYPVST